MTISALQAKSFDKIAATYARVRPGYPKEVYDLARDVGKLGVDSWALEIGAGHGVATREISESIDCSIDAIEPGRQLCEHLRAALADRPKVAVHPGSFEVFSSTKNYSAIFAATSFHWLDPATKYQKCAELLDRAGILVLYWNNYTLGDRRQNDLLQQVYQKHFPTRDFSQSIYEVQREKIQKRKEEMANSGVFVPSVSRTFLRTHEFTIEQYLDLLRTFSENSILDRSIADPFYRDIEACLSANGKTVNIDVVTNLEIGKKR